jgi:pimeloyl-ACP methyl ester carboxylesterase
MAGLGTVEGAIFGIMGLLLAFTISGALHRFDDDRFLEFPEKHLRSGRVLRGAPHLSVAVAPAVGEPGQLQAYETTPIHAKIAGYVKKLETSYCINSARVFAAGFSWGGDFVTALACMRGNVLRAVAINSASDEFNDRANPLTYQDLPCLTTSYPAIRFEHAIGGDGAYPAPDFATTSKLFQSFNACKGACGVASTAAASSTSTMTCVSYNGCGKEYIECSFNASIGHAFPPNWAADTWAFFQKAIRTREGFLLYPNPRLFHWLPMHAFRDTGDVERFAELAKSKVREYAEVG